MEQPVATEQRQQGAAVRTRRPRYRGVLSPYITPKEPIPLAAVTILGILGFVVPLLLWSVLTYGHLVDPFFLPTPTAVLQAAWTMLAQDNFLADVWASVVRVMAGFAISAVIGVPLGILIGSFRSVQAFFEPLFSFARYLPASAFIPLLIVWVGIDDREKVAIIIIGSLFQLTLLVADVSASVQKELLHIAYTLGASRWQVFTRVLIPATLPDVVNILRIVAGWAWTYLIVAEIVGAQTGIGHVIIAASRDSFVDQIIVGIVTIGIIGFITDMTFRLVHRLLFPYVERVSR